MSDIDCRTRGARIAERVAAIGAAIGLPILIVLLTLGSFVFGVVREMMIWGVW